MVKDTELIAGRRARGSSEVVITDFIANCISGPAADGKLNTDYNALLSDGYITLKYNSLQISSKIVGIVETDAMKYSHLNNYNSKSLSLSMRQCQDRLLAPQSSLDAEFCTFLYKFAHSYCLIYNDGSLDGEIVKMSKQMSIESDYSAGDYSFVCFAVSKDSALLPSDKYCVG